ncbi:MAG: hypothetical protein NWF00_04810 [Candidatus Bathyarchaeota archaeon]|nr:hypothetical protein [Candidatus Bathyarchaeota archaeon]
MPQTAKDILGVLGANGVAAEACAVAGVTKGAVWYWKEWFLHDGALLPRLEESPLELNKPWKERKVGPGYPRYYDLTPYGRTLLTGSDARLHFPVVLEDRPRLFRVLRRESVRINWEKCGSVRHWHKMDTSLLGVTVELHAGLGSDHAGANVEIHPGPMKGYNVDLLEMDAARVIERVRFLLEHKFGMELSAEGWFPKNKSGESGPRILVYRPEAKGWVPVATVDIPGVAGLDASRKKSRGGVRDPLSGEPHFEFSDKRDAAFAALAPVWPRCASDPDKQGAVDATYFATGVRELHAMVRGLVSQVNVLTVKVGEFKQFEGQVSLVMQDLRVLASALSKLENLDKLGPVCESLQKVSRVLTQLFDAEGNGDQSQASGEGGKDYVA